MATVTDPIILDSTGQDIVTALNNLNTPRDTAAYTTSFASSDTDDASATSWTVVSPIAGGETHATLFGKLSQIAKNVRYLYKTLGNTDLSAISDGTVSGAIDYLAKPRSVTVTPSGQGIQTCFRMGDVVFVSFESNTVSTITHGTVILQGLPTAKYNNYMTIGMANGRCCPCLLSGNKLSVYYPSGTITAGRLDGSFWYLTSD